jgi:hypothetical protein
VRTVAEGRGDTLYVGTTRNSILQGSVHTGFSLLIQVSAVLAPSPSAAISPLFCPVLLNHPVFFLYPGTEIEPRDSHSSP